MRFNGAIPDAYSTGAYPDSLVSQTLSFSGELLLVKTNRLAFKYESCEPVGCGCNPLASVPSSSSHLMMLLPRLQPWQGTSIEHDVEVVPTEHPSQGQ